MVLNLYVKPDKPVVSYLTALTGVTAEHVQQWGRPLAEQVRARLQRRAAQAEELGARAALQQCGTSGLQRVQGCGCWVSTRAVVGRLLATGRGRVTWGPGTKGHRRHGQAAV